MVAFFLKKIAVDISDFCINTIYIAFFRYPYFLLSARKNVHLCHNRLIRGRGRGRSRGRRRGRGRDSGSGRCRGRNRFRGSGRGRGSACGRG